jgi:hypothetical protein
VPGGHLACYNVLLGGQSVSVPSPWVPISWSSDWSSLPVASSVVVVESTADLPSDGRSRVSDLSASPVLGDEPPASPPRALTITAAATVCVGWPKTAMITATRPMTMIIDALNRFRREVLGDRRGLPVLGVGVGWFLLTKNRLTCDDAVVDTGRGHAVAVRLDMA